MKKFLILCLWSVIALAQDPVNTNVVRKRVVKVGTKFFIETRTTMAVYQELTKEMLFDTENDATIQQQDEAELARINAEREAKKAQRIEQNKLLRDAIKNGYDPPNQTLEEINRIKNIKKRLGV